MFKSCRVYIAEAVLLLSCALSAAAQGGGVVPLQGNQPINTSFNNINVSEAYLDSKQTQGAGAPSITCSAGVNLGYFYVNHSASGAFQSLYLCTTQNSGATYVWEGPYGAGGGGGGVNSVGLSMPSWLSVSGSPVTSSGVFAVTPNTGQTSHQFIGTCGTATSFVPCSIVAGDVPTLNQSTTGNAATATAAASTPALCSAGSYSLGILASFAATGCTVLPFSSLTTTGTSGAATLSAGVLNIPQYQQALTLTTTGSSGAATLSAGTLNIPQYSGGGSANSVFTGSTATNPAFSATPTFSLADVSVKSPLRVEPGAMTANVTAVTFTNTCAGCKFSIAWTQDGTGGRTVTYGGSTSNTCQPSPTAGITTTQEFEIGQDGTTVKGTGCSTTEVGVSRPATASGAPTVTSASPNAVQVDSNNVLSVVVNGHSGSNTAVPQTCSAGSYFSAFALAGGAFTCTPATLTICSGTVALGTSAIASGAAATTVTATCTGLAATDTISMDFNGSPLAVTGYVPSANGMLSVLKWPATNTINISVVNNTSASITPGAITLNYRVVR